MDPAYISLMTNLFPMFDGNEYLAIFSQEISKTLKRISSPYHFNNYFVLTPDFIPLNHELIMKTLYSD